MLPPPSFNIHHLGFTSKGQDAWMKAVNDMGHTVKKEEATISYWLNTASGSPQNFYFSPAADQRHSFIVFGDDFENLSSIVYAIFTLQIPTLVFIFDENSIYYSRLSAISEKSDGLLTLWFDDPHSSKSDVILNFISKNTAFEGKLYVIDGPDGVGKTTQVEMIMKNLSSSTTVLKTLKFPNRSSHCGSLIYHILEKRDRIHSIALATLYAANRFDKLSVLNWWLWKGFTVILDRYTTSNIAYQMAHEFSLGSGMPDNIIEMFEDIEYTTFRLPKPTRVFFLTMSYENCLRNITEHRKTNLDYFEKRGPTFFSFLISAYRWCREHYGSRVWTEIKCDNKTKDEIFAEIINEMEIL